MVRHWDRLPREALGAPSLEAFEARLDGALGSRTLCVAALPTAVVFERGGLSGPFQPKAQLVTDDVTWYRGD